MVGRILGEAALLGVTGEGALSLAGRLVVAADKAADRATAARLAPPSNELTLQADLTCVAPAALDAGVDAELALMADVESTGAATVLRFSEASVRRALDAGRSAAELLAFLVDHSPKGVPQPLRYLLADVARRHGAIRIGRVGSYLRCDDPALVAQVLRTRRAGAS
ncbi:MAG: helicase-associated domain-containing protein [Acidimicrobiales bacterium]